MKTTDTPFSDLMTAGNILAAGALAALGLWEVAQTLLLFGILVETIATKKVIRDKDDF